MTYEEIRPTLKTGDLVLFSGRGFISRAIQLGTKSFASHVGMVIVPEDVDLVLIVESTSLYRKRDMWSGNFRSGVQIHPLSIRLQDYKGYAVIRPLENRLTGGQRKRLMAFLKDMRDVPYPSGFNGKLRVMLSGFHLNNAGATGVWCSQFIGRAMKEIGLFPAEVQAYNLSPADLTQKYESVKGVWSDEIKLKG